MGSYYKEQNVDSLKKLQKGQNARPAMRCRSAMSVEELSNLTRKINIQMAQPTGLVNQNGSVLFATLFAKLFSIIQGESLSIRNL